MLVELTKQLRELLSDTTGENHAAHDDFLNELNACILEISSANDDGQQRHDFEEELQVIFDEDVDYSEIRHGELFLEVLLHARPIMAPSTLISTWFDLLLRPALREPRLSVVAVEAAKSLILESMEDSSESIVISFRRRLLDLFLLDGLNESTGKDILEWAKLDGDQRSRNSHWKSNLKDILVTFGLRNPEELFDVMNDCFASPRYRLQLLSLVDCLLSHSSFLEISPTFLAHAFMDSMLRSLEVDNSATVCAVELSILVKVIPALTIRAYDPFKDVMARLFAVLGRVLCWKARTRRTPDIRVPYTDLLDYNDEALVSELERKEAEEELEDFQESWQVKLKIREDLKWKRLERTFDMSTSSNPSPRHFFAMLYFIFPCNVIHFLRNPTAYLQEKNVESPWTVGWDEALDDSQIRSAATSLLRTFTVHPMILTHDVVSELADTNRWASYDVSRILGESMMLTVPSFVGTITESESSADLPTSTRLRRAWSHTGDRTASQTPRARPIPLDTPRLPQKNSSLHELIATSAAIKSGLNLSAIERPLAGPSLLFTPPPSQAPSRSGSVDSSMLPTIPSTPEHGQTIDDTNIPSQISETIAGLQKELLLLRTELSFEHWLKKENVRHISRLYEDSVANKSAELQQQRQQNRLREYRSQVAELKNELKNHQDQALRMKVKQVEWNEELQAKNSELREQKKNWLAEANALRSANVDLKAHLAAQGKLLDVANNKVFELETTIKTDAHKVQRLRDYEKRIEQLTEMHRMWNKDIDLYNEQSKEMSTLISEYQKMKLRVETYEHAQEDLESTIRSSRQRIQTLEAELRTVQRKNQPLKENVVQMLSMQASERDMLSKSNTALRSENAELQFQLEDLRAELEMMKTHSPDSSSKGLLFPEALSTGI